MKNSLCPTRLLVSMVTVEGMVHWQTWRRNCPHSISLLSCKIEFGDYLVARVVSADQPLLHKHIVLFVYVGSDSIANDVEASYEKQYEALWLIQVVLKPRSRSVYSHRIETLHCLLSISTFSTSYLYTCIGSYATRITIYIMALIHHQKRSIKLLRGLIPM